jgi:hypothetical protein
MEMERLGMPRRRCEAVLAGEFCVPMGLECAEQGLSVKSVAIPHTVVMGAFSAQVDRDGRIAEADSGVDGGFGGTEVAFHRGMGFGSDSRPLRFHCSGRVSFMHSALPRR